MNDRELLLKAIQAEPGDRTARLVYADWLDDHPELPGAAATAEFVRLCCKPVRGPWDIPLEAYLWFHVNAKRLVPSVVALSVPITEPSDRWPAVPEGGMEWNVAGTKIDTYVTLAAKNWRGVSLYSCRLRLHFWMGLCDHWTMGSAFGRERVEPALRTDRPELFLPPRGGNVSTPGAESA